MRVLFVYRSHQISQKKPVVENQAIALENNTDIQLFRCSIQKGGIKYLKLIKQIHYLAKKHKVDLIHAHYSLCGFAASLAFTGIPVVCSLMGSELWDNTITRPLIPLFYKHCESKIDDIHLKIQEHIYFCNTRSFGNLDYNLSSVSTCYLNNSFLYVNI